MGRPRFSVDPNPYEATSFQYDLDDGCIGGGLGMGASTSESYGILANRVANNVNELERIKGHSLVSSSF